MQSHVLLKQFARDQDQDFNVFAGLATQAMAQHVQVYFHFFLIVTIAIIFHRLVLTMFASYCKSNQIQTELETFVAIVFGVTASRKHCIII